jgi:N-acetylmuramoyl-L-alanine amidase
MDLKTIYEIALLALCIWREARGESVAAKEAVAWAIRNRVLHPTWWGVDWITVILKPAQFSSFNANDPNAVKWPQMVDNTWLSSLVIAQAVHDGKGVDPTGGATHYFDDSLKDHPPAWAQDGSMELVTKIGSLNFWRRAQ